MLNQQSGFRCLIHPMMRPLMRSQTLPVTLQAHRVVNTEETQLILGRISLGCGVFLVLVPFYPTT